MHRYVAFWTESTDRDDEWAHYTVAALIAARPPATETSRPPKTRPQRPQKTPEAETPTTAKATARTSARRWQSSAGTPNASTPPNGVCICSPGKECPGYNAICQV